MAVVSDDGPLHVAEVVVKDLYRHDGVEPVAQRGEAAQVGEQHRHLATLGHEDVGRVGQPLHHVFRHEALELALHLFQLLLGGQQQFLGLACAARAAQPQRGKHQREQRRQPCQ